MHVHANKHTGDTIHILQSVSRYSTDQQLAAVKRNVAMHQQRQKEEDCKLVNVDVNDVGF